MHSGLLRPGQQGLPILITPELGRCFLGKHLHHLQELLWPLSSTPASGGWYRKLLAEGSPLS